MPRYRYQCEECEEFTDAIHSYKEVLTDCEKCNTEKSLKKMISVPYYGAKKLSEDEAKIGNITNKFIEENRNVLKQQKEEIKDKKHVKD
jgi:putative FmdB family regulatory protein